jgi:hypothetical protein
MVMIIIFFFSIPLTKVLTIHRMAKKGWTALEATFSNALN